MTNSIDITPTNLKMEEIRGSYYLKGTVTINGKELPFSFDLHSTYDHVDPKDHNSEYVYEPCLSVEGLDESTLELLNIKFDPEKLIQTYKKMTSQLEAEKKLTARNVREKNYDSLSIVALHRRLSSFFSTQGFSVRLNASKKEYIDSDANVNAMYVEKTYKSQKFECSIYSGRSVGKFEVCVQRAKSFVQKDEKILSNITDGWKQFTREIDEKAAEQKEKSSFVQAFKKNTGLTLTREEKSSRNEYARGNEPRYRYFDVFSVENKEKNYSFTTSEASFIRSSDGKETPVKNHVHVRLSATVSYEKLNEVLAILNSK